MFVELKVEPGFKALRYLVSCYGEETIASCPELGIYTIGPTKEAAVCELNILVGYHLNQW